jgi:hypothetical protein
MRIFCLSFMSLLRDEQCWLAPQRRKRSIGSPTISAISKRWLLPNRELIESLYFEMDDSCFLLHTTEQASVQHAQPLPGLLLAPGGVGGWVESARKVPAGNALREAMQYGRK